MYRSDRSLLETSRKLKKKDPALIESLVAERLEHGEGVRVLEVGFGQGRTLVELAVRFRSDPVRLFGVDKTCEPPLECREDLRETARRYGSLPRMSWRTGTWNRFDWLLQAWGIAPAR